MDLAKLHLFKMKLCLHSIDNNMLMIGSGSQDACFCINAIVMISFAGEVFYRCCYFASGDKHNMLILVNNR